MDEQVRQLRAQVRRVQQGRPPTAVRYPIAIRRRATALARRRHAERGEVTAIARAVGVAPWTLALWLRRPRGAVMRTVFPILPHSARRESKSLFTADIGTGSRKPEI